MIFLGFSNLKDSKTTPINYNECKDYELKSGAVIEGDVEFVIGSFEESYETNYGKKDNNSVKYKYAIPVGEDKYMGFSVKAGEKTTLFDKMADQTWDYMDGKSDKTPQPYHFIGKVIKLDKESHGYFKNAFMSIGFSDSDAEKQIVDFYIDERKFDGYGWNFLIGIVILGIGVAWTVVHKNRTGSIF